MTQSITAITTAQYNWVQDSRKVLFAYCQTIDPAHFTDQNTSFGRGGSMRNLLTHIANTYQYWIGFAGLGKEMVYDAYEDQKNIADVMRLFESIDQLVFAFINRLPAMGATITYEANGNTVTVEPLKLFTHVITHEYHHKGQVLSISRHLGYTPVDTDIMR